MKAIVKNISAALVACFLLLSMATQQEVFAAPTDCSINYSGFSVTGTWPNNPVMNAGYAPIQISFSNVPAGIYKINCSTEANLSYYDYGSYRNIVVTNVDANNRGTLVWNVNENTCFKQQSGMSNAANWDSFVKIELESDPNSACTAIRYTLMNASNRITCNSANITFSNSAGQSGCFEVGEQVNWNIRDIRYDGGALVNGDELLARTTNGIINGSNLSRVGVSEGIASGTITLGSAGQNFALAFGDIGGTTTFCSSGIPIRASGGCTPDDRENPPPASSGEAPPFVLCQQAAPEDLAACKACVASGNITNPNDPNQKFWTAFGCVSVTKEGVVTSLLRVGIGISGGFVLLSILYGAFLLTTSSGDPNRVKEGQEMITSAIMGLMFVIFSIIILRFIGVSILRIPGFGT